MDNAVKEPITEDGQKVLVEVKDGEMLMTLEATPYELFTIANQILLNISESTSIDMEGVLKVLTQFNEEEGK